MQIASEIFLEMRNDYTKKEKKIILKILKIFMGL